MSSSDKVTNCLGPLMVDVAGLELTTEDRELLHHPLTGGLILFTRNFENKEQLAVLTKEIRSERSDILLAVDYEGGRVQRFREGFTRIPAMRRLGQAFDRDASAAVDLAGDCGWLLASELREFDIDLAFSPVLDLDCGVSEVIGDRALHADPQTVVHLASAFMAGMHKAGMAATGKHFPGHGHVAPDSHVELPVDGRRLEEIQATDMQPFRQLIKAGLPSIMMAHIRFPSIDDLPASLSRRWIQGQLREELGFGGAVFCDDLSMGGAGSVGGYLERAQLALEAGCDMLPVCNHRQGVEELLDGLRWQPGSEAQQRLQLLRASSGGVEDRSRHRHIQAALASLIAS